jgi:ABC-2 type transport system permease protein
LFNLVLNENMKIYRRVRTWVMIGLVLFVIAGMGALTKTMDHYKSSASGNWKSQLQMENGVIQKKLADKNVTGSERSQLESDLARNQYALDQNVAPEQNTGMKFALDAATLSGLLTIFAVVVAGDIVASEFSWGTIKLLLIRPKNRTKILLAKYLSTLLFGLLLLAILFVFSYVVGGLLFGFGGAGQPDIYSDANGAPHQTTTFLFALLIYGLKAVTMVMIVTIAFMISAAFRSSALAIALSILILFVGDLITVVIGDHSWSKYVLFVNLDLSKYIQGGNVFDGMTLGFSASVLAVYFVIFNACAWLLFVKRDVAA